MIIWCFSCAWALVLLCSWSLWSALSIGIKQLQRLHRVPCNHCMFCTGDYRLKCTVHPITAFSEEAINCPDFQAGLHSSPSSKFQIKSRLATD